MRRHFSNSCSHVYERSQATLTGTKNQRDVFLQVVAHIRNTSVISQRNKSLLDHHTVNHCISSVALLLEEQSQDRLDLIQAMLAVR